jgi:hypothetical protein
MTHPLILVHTPQTEDHEIGVAFEGLQVHARRLGDMFNGKPVLLEPVKVLLHRSMHIDDPYVRREDELLQPEDVILVHSVGRKAPL